jgi:hypothetical protein
VAMSKDDRAALKAAGVDLKAAAALPPGLLLALIEFFLALLRKKDPPGA